MVVEILLLKLLHFLLPQKSHLARNLTLDVGVRKTDEDKSVSIASLSAGVAFLAQVLQVMCIFLWEEIHQ
jgi:hypothetical protein